MRKSPADWTEQDSFEVLTNSPWVSMSLVGRSRGSIRRIDTYYRFRLLTAAPIRLAWLVQLPLIGGVRTVSVSELQAGTLALDPDPKAETRISLPPLLDQGSEDFIIISISTTQRLIETAPGLKEPTEWPPRNENWYPDGLMGLQLHDLIDVTFLSTVGGKRVSLVRFEAPTKDLLGAKFYFPRRLPDGSPLVSIADKNFRFETRIDGRKVIGRFKVGRMIYRGKLEM